MKNLRKKVQTLKMKKKHASILSVHTFKKLYYVHKNKMHLQILRCAQ